MMPACTRKMGRKSRVKTRAEVAREDRGTNDHHLRELAQRKLKQQIRQRKQNEKWKQKRAERDAQQGGKHPKELAALLIRESLKLPGAFTAPSQAEMAAVYHKANSQRLPPQSYTPWLAEAAVGPGVPFTRVSLHDEILAFQRYVSLRPEEVGAREAINSLIRDVVQSRWPGAVVATFGSLAASLSTFLSDIDCTVCDAQQARQHEEEKSGVPHLFEAKDDEDETDSDDEAGGSGKGRMGGILGKRTRDEEETESEEDDEDSEDDDEDDDDDDEEEEEEEGEGRREEGEEKGEGEEQKEVIVIHDSDSEDDVAQVEREDTDGYTFNVMFHENPKPRGNAIKGAASAPLARRNGDSKFGPKPRHTQSEMNQRYQAKGHLMRLYPGFTRLPVLLHSEMRLHARVPIINMRFLNNVEADIRIHPPDTSAVRFLQRLAERHNPAFTALAVLLKVVCFMHNIDKPFNGGLGSFKLYVLLAHFLANHQGQDVGNLLKKFLQIYSRAGALDHTMTLRVEGQDITLQGQLELEKIRACFEMCHKILTTDDVKQVRRATGEGTGPSTQTRLARMLWGLALGRLREEAHRQAMSAIQPLSQFELTQAGKRLLDKLRRETSTDYPSLEELRQRFPKAASHVEVYCTLFRQEGEWAVDTEAVQRVRLYAKARSKATNGKARRKSDQHRQRSSKKARLGYFQQFR